jgi:hypothetical protein
MADPVKDQPRAPRGPRARGRRVASVIYWATVAGICIAGAAEVSWQVLAQPALPAPYASCHEGLRALYGAMVRAREAAAHTDTGEDAALARFRDALSPEWNYRDGVALRCKGSAKDEGALDAIERLRYAEEHAVRREAGELAPLRRRVQAIVDGELGGLPAPAWPLQRPASSSAQSTPSAPSAPPAPSTPPSTPQTPQRAP